MSPGPTNSIPRTSCTSDNAAGLLDSDHAMSQAISHSPSCGSASISTVPLSSPPSATGTVASNPLVECGLISPDLTDILATPSMDAVVVQKRVKRIRGARDLTAEDYVEMLREDKRKKEELEKEKERKRQERLMKKKEREMAKQQKCGVGRGRGRGRGRGKKLSGTGRETGKGKERQIPDNVTDSEIDSSTGNRASDTDSDTMELEDIRPQRRRQLPARYRSDDDKDENDGVLCSICNLNVPDNLASETIFWIDCDVCGVWVHNVCAFGSNTVTRQYKCEGC